VEKTVENLTSICVTLFKYFSDFHKARSGLCKTKKKCPKKIFFGHKNVILTVIRQ
jgi:hypothetical protein